MKIRRIMKIWLKIQNSKRWLKNTYCFYFKSTGLPRREAESDLNGGKRSCDLGREKRFPRDPIPGI
jgi:hypothetical protein